MYLIVGLGNPGSEYNNTRHNIGFEMLDRYTSSKNINLSNEKFKGLFTKVDVNGTNVIFAKPMTYMNLSGNFIRDIINFYKIELNNVLVIYDDMDLPLGKIRLKDNGSAGGHNGIKSIIDCLGTEKFKRLKCGIGRPSNKNIPIPDHVLGKFSSEEQNLVNTINDKVFNIINGFIKGETFLSLMNKFN